MDIMHAIADIEQKSQEIINSANELEQCSNEVLAEEIRKREETMKKKLEEQCADLKRRSELECSEKLSSLEEKYSTKIGDIKISCEKNKNKWINEIYKAVVE